MTPVQVGICEDDPELRSVLSRALEHEGFAVRLTTTGHEAVERFSEEPPDVLVLDIGLPDADGRDVCQALRARGTRAPVLFLTAREALTDRLSGFHAGGDDYLTKPFVLAELLVRIHALSRRLEPAPAPGATELVLDPATHDVRAGEHAAPLTPTEFRLLASLAGRPGEIIRRHQLISAAWPDGAIVHANTLDTYMGRLRRKLREIGSEEHIDTVRGVGYSLR
jgi:two-component system OmpR family response regulator